MTDMADDGARLASLLERQRGLFTQLDALSARQNGLIIAEDTDRLLGVLAERQRLVDQIAATSAELEPMRARWEALVAGLTAVQRDRVRACVSAVAEMAGAIAARDEEDRGLLAARRDSVAGELGGVTRGRDAVAAYGGRGAGAAKFQDRRA